MVSGGGRAVREGGSCGGGRRCNPGIRMEPGAVSTILCCDGFQSAAGLHGRLPAACPGIWLARPASHRSVQVARRRKISPASALNGRDGMAGRNQPKGTAGCGAPRFARRRHRDGAGLGCRCGPSADRGFLGKNPSFSLGFPGRGLGFRKTKNPLPGGSGLRMRSLGAPQFIHFPCAAAARFVVVTWLICQEATACRRTKARGQPIWEAGADMVCSEQFMELVIAGSVPAMCGR